MSFYDGILYFGKTHFSLERVLEEKGWGKDFLKRLALDTIIINRIKYEQRLEREAQNTS